MSALPLYLQVRRVRACQIKAVQGTPTGGLVHPVEQFLDPIPVPMAFMVKQRPAPGGYLVIQDNGYMRFALREEIEDSFYEVSALQDRREQLEVQLNEIDQAIEAEQRSAA